VSQSRDKSKSKSLYKFWNNLEKLALQTEQLLPHLVSFPKNDAKTVQDQAKELKKYINSSYLIDLLHKGTLALESIDPNHPLYENLRRQIVIVWLALQPD